jgi:2-desacetyl-2-hydroxyethyl bacteriochlorophyllide A dehydrogenase
MKAGVYYGARDIRTEDIEIPKTGPADILVKVMSSGICGSDLHSYRQGVFCRPGWVLGHELSGEVVSVGAKVKDIKKGDRVIPFRRTAGGTEPCGKCFWCQRGEPQYCENVTTRKPCGKCEFCLKGQWWLCTEMSRYMNVGYSRNGGNSEFAAVYDAELNQNVFKLPDNMSYDEGAAVEPLVGCLEWVSLASPQPHDTAVVMGLGTIGLLTVQVLKQKVSRVIGSELSQKRLQVARELGADIVIDPSKENPVEKVIEATGVGRSRSGKGGGRADFVMECSGAGVALQQALEITRSGGKIVLVGLYEKPVTIDPNLIVFKDLKLISSQTRRVVPANQLMLQAIDEIASGRIKIKPLISHEFSIDKIKEAFETQAKSAESVKVIIKP